MPVMCPRDLQDDLEMFLAERGWNIEDFMVEMEQPGKAMHSLNTVQVAYPHTQKVYITIGSSGCTTKY